MARILRHEVDYIWEHISSAASSFFLGILPLSGGRYMCRRVNFQITPNALSGERSGMIYLTLSSMRCGGTTYVNPDCNI